MDRETKLIIASGRSRLCLCVFGCILVLGFLLVASLSLFLGVGWGGWWWWGGGVLNSLMVEFHLQLLVLREAFELLLSVTKEVSPT